MTPIESSLIDHETLEMALDRYNCYPMENVILYIQIHLPEKKQQVLHLSMPSTLDIEKCFIGDQPDREIQFSVGTRENEIRVSIPVDQYVDEDGNLELSFQLKLESYMINHVMTMNGQLTLSHSQTTEESALGEISAEVHLTVKNHASYLNYLPELYEQDEFMNRFLMLFESFWKPINDQIAQDENYFDPDLTPAAFLPWLASWIGMSIDETLSEEEARKMIRSAIELYHCRGTLYSIKMFLDLFTGGETEVKESRAKNMVLGKDSRIGEEYALGLMNQPNTIVITMHIPSDKLSSTGFTKQMYQQKIASVLRDYIPAGSVFTLNCDLKND